MKNPKDAQRVRVGLSPSGAELLGSPDMTYSQLLTRSGIDLPTDCGGAGTCGRCRLHFLDGLPSPTRGDVDHFTLDELANGWRLACGHHLESGSMIEVSLGVEDLCTKGDSTIEIALARLDPGLRSVRVQLPATKTSGASSRAALLATCLGSPVRLTPAALRDLSAIEVDADSEIDVVIRSGDAIAVRSQASAGQLAGLAVDIGTTTLAVYIHDLQTGQRLGGAIGRNPQRSYGADIITRIGYARATGLEGVEALRRAVVEGLALLIEQACAEAQIASDDLWRAVVVGNPTMLHLFLGVSPVGIDQSPYTPVFENAVDGLSEEIGLPIRRGAHVRLLPAISAYVGADVVSGILATHLGQHSGPELLIDVGTNGEMVLAIAGRRIACSTAAGPAFEGASISQGMYALPGAIGEVRMGRGGLECRVIGDRPPAGICGTGILSAVAVLLEAGVIDETGRLTATGGPLDTRLSGTGREGRFRLTERAPHVFLSQADVREFQLAKAAIRAGIDALLSSVCLDSTDLERILVGGALGTHLDAASAIRTGLLPPLPLGKILAVGNTAGQGAVLALLDRRKESESDEIARTTKYLELATSAGFAESYIARIGFPPLGERRDSGSDDPA